MLLSIIIPTLNPGDKLRATLDSIYAQSFADLEIWVQDGGSTDGTLELLAAESGVLWKSELDAGIYDAMNRGIQATKGEWLLFLGAGDRLEAQILPRLQAVLRDRAEWSVVYGDVWWPALNRRYDGRFSAWKVTQRPPCHQAVFTRRAVFSRVGQFDLRYPIAADFAFHIAVFGDTRIEKQWVDEVICTYEGGGISTNRRDEIFIDDLPRLIKRHYPAPLFWLYALRRASPRRLKSWGAPFLRRLGWIPDEKLLTQIPKEENSNSTRL